MKLRWAMTAVLACALAAAPVRALDLGDKAPTLRVKDWVKGGPISLKEGKGKNIYVVEFWATRCPICCQAIPNLTELQKQYKDKGVVFIGISDEKADIVKPFVEKMGAKMDYVVATDDDQATAERYMLPFKIIAIPHAFVVDKNGILVWEGNPLIGLDRVVQQVVDGEWSVEKAKKEKKVADQILKIKLRLWPKYYEVVAKEDKIDPKKAAKIGAEIVEKAKDSPEYLNWFAWTILTDLRFRYRDVELALKAAQMAVDGTAGQNAAILDTYARAQWENGNKAEAVKNQKKAVERCEPGDEKLKMGETLKKYENTDPPKPPAEKKDVKKEQKEAPKEAKKEKNTEKKHGEKKGDKGEDKGRDD